MGIQKGDSEGEALAPYICIVLLVVTQGIMTHVLPFSLGT